MPTTRYSDRPIDVADATLRHDFPEVHAMLFQNLTKTSGHEVIISVGVFLKRLDELEESGEPQALEALAVLAKRSLDAEQRRIAAELLEQAATVSPASPEPTTTTAREPMCFS